MTEFEKSVYRAVKKIPRGKVATYAAVARGIGRPRLARAVGNALNKNRDKSVPCHRVVKSDGSVGGYAYGTRKKMAMLMSEGVRIIKDKVAKENILVNFQLSNSNFQ